MTGAVIEVPVIAATVWVTAHLGIGNPDPPFMRVLRITAVFTGIAALLTAGGIGRLAATTASEHGRPRAISVATRAHAAATAGLVVIAAIPHGRLPLHHVAWIVPPLFGALAGAACGAVIGTVCTGATPVGIGDVLSLAKRPSEALRQLLSPDDLLRFGAALRQRTSQMFEGMFEPAQRPPSEHDPAESSRPPTDT
jgi:hypothetical protein